MPVGARTATPDAVESMLNPIDAIRILDDLAGDPRTGLPEDLFLFISRMTPLVNVDLPDSGRP